MEAQHHSPDQNHTHSSHPGQPHQAKDSSKTHTTQQKQSGGSIRLYIFAALASIVLGGGVAVYTSELGKTPVTPGRVDDDAFNAILVSVEAPPPPVVSVAPEPVKESAPAFTPDAVIDVPSVGLRKSPDVDAATVGGSLKKGEGVLILDRRSGGGPPWVKVKSKSGKTGWVFASVVKEKRRK